MKKTYWFLLFLAAASLSACAPAYYEASYYDYPDPSGHLAVVSNHNFANYGYRPVSSHYGSIEVTLFANSGIVGANFQPIYLFMHDGAYVEVPVRNRRGELKKIYAHYHLGDLHFDSGRHCNNLHGSSRFKHDKRWDGGHRYKHVSAGPDYDLSGYEIHIRKHVNKKNHDKYNSQYSQHKVGPAKKNSFAYDGRSIKRHVDPPFLNAETGKRKVENRHVYIDNRVKQKVSGKKILVRQNKRKNNEQTKWKKRVVRKNGSRSEEGIVSRDAKNVKRVKKKELLKNKHLKGKYEVSSKHIKEKEKKTNIELEVDRLVTLAEDENFVYSEHQRKPYRGPLKKNRK